MHLSYIILREGRSLNCRENSSDGNLAWFNSHEAFFPVSSLTRRETKARHPNARALMRTHPVSRATSSVQSSAFLRVRTRCFAVDTRKIRWRIQSARERVNLKINSPRLHFAARLLIFSPRAYRVAKIKTVPLLFSRLSCFAESFARFAWWSCWKKSFLSFLASFIFDQNGKEQRREQWEIVIDGTKQR